MEIDISKLSRQKGAALLSALVLTSVRFIDRNGKAHVSPPRSHYGEGGPLSKPPERIHIGAQVDSLAKDDPPKAIEAEIVTDVSEKSYSFELKNVPRPKPKK